MRIADRKDKLLMGQMNNLDADAMKAVEDAIDELSLINRDIWQTVGEYNYPT